MDWVKAMDELPAKNGFYLVYRRDVIKLACYMAGMWHEGGYYNNRLYDVTHWMPLPDAPRSE